MSNKTQQTRSEKKKTRRTQDQRRKAMRNCILDATLDCLAQYGYAATGVRQIVEQAGVSRGALSHHFPSMNNLILEAARHLMNRVYERLATVLQQLPDAEDRMQEVIQTAWREFFASEVNAIYLELLVAARRDEELAEVLGQLSREIEQKLGDAATLFFEPVPGAVNEVIEIMHLNRWVLRGIALDAPLIPNDGVQRALAVWTKLVSTQISPRDLEKMPE